MKRWILIAVLLIVAVGGWLGYQRYQAQQLAQQQAAEAQDAQAADLESVIWASGKLEPLRWSELSSVNQGIVEAIHVQEGDWVEAGDVLLELDTMVLESQLQEAEAALAEAQAALDKLRAGATSAEIAAAQAAVDAAKASVAQAAGQMLETQAAIEAAEAAVEVARRQYEEMASHPTPAELQVARAEVAVAEAAVIQAQAAYNLVRGDPNIAARPESMTLAQATAALEAARAKAALTEQGPTPQQLAVAQANIQAAEAQVKIAQSRIPGAEANVKAALASQASAEAALEKLLAGATPEDIAMAEARVQSAQAAVNSARARLRQSQIVAPFAGQVGQINVRVGEPGMPGQPLVLLGDTRTMHVVTTDLRETDVVKVDVGMPVEVTFDALPDQIFTGTITWIAPVSTTEQGSTNYRLFVDVAELDPSLRWGMTAFVNIYTGQ